MVLYILIDVITGRLILKIQRDPEMSFLCFISEGLVGV